MPRRRRGAHGSKDAGEDRTGSAPEDGGQASADTVDQPGPADTATPASAGSPVRRRIGWALIVVGGLIVLAGAWLIVTGLLVRSQLDQARADVHKLRAQISAADYGGAQVTLDDLRSHAGHASFLTSGPAWALAARLPAGGQAFRSARGIALGVNSLADDALPVLLDARRTLDPSHLREPDGSVDLAPIAAAAPGLSRADATLSAVRRDVAALPSRTWIPAIDSARTELLAQIGDIATPVHTVALASKIVPPMLGRSGTRTYFVGFQNEAEARGTGGLPGAFGILSITSGRAHFERFENDSYLSQVDTGLDLGAEYGALWGGYQPTSVYVNSNVSANFPYAARIWTAMWAKMTGQRLDGAIAVDPTALGYLLGAAGPTTLPDGTPLTADNVATLTQSTVYAKFGTDTNGRKAYLLDIARAASKQIIADHGSSSSLLSAATRAAREGRVLVWSADPGVEADLVQTPVSGQVRDTAAPFVGPVVINKTGSKLDYYLDRTTDWQRTGCGSTRSVTVTMRLTDSAPASGLPAYVTTRADHPTYAVRPGDERVYLDYYATDGAQLDSATVDGTAVETALGTERGHPVISVDVELPRTRTRTVVLHLTEPAGVGAPVVLDQPSVRPQTITVHDMHCGT